MINHTIIDGLKLKQLMKVSGLTSKEVNILLTVRFAGSLATPTLNKILGIDRTKMNRVIGPKLMELGWLRRVDTGHRNSRLKIMPTYRWSIPEEKLDDLRLLEQQAYDNLNEVLNRELAKDLDWVSKEDVA